LGTGFLREEIVIDRSYIKTTIECRLPSLCTNANATFATPTFMVSHLDSAAELLEEHMEDRHPLSKPARGSEDLRLTTADEEFLTSMRIGW
jgi:hypothetical protein